jgi:cellulose synthase/poly-beta-1,6-N-acetylglucosamine synthase-like glycosyltransferase
MALEPRGIPVGSTAPAGAAAAARPLLGETLVAAGLAAAAAVEGALARQRDMDAPLGRILVADQAISQEDLTLALARQSGLPLVDLGRTPPEPELLAALDPYRCLELEAVPWRHIGENRVIVVGNPHMAEAARAELGGGARRVSVALARPEEVRGAIVAHFGLQFRDDAQLRCPEPYSCRTIASRRWRALAALGVAALVAGSVAAPLVMLRLLMFWVLLMTALTTGLRLFALLARLRSGRQVIAADVPRLADFQRLPTVSLLVPLKGEAAVAGELVRSLAEIDYPPALLDIKLVLEEEDLVTRVAIERAALPPCFEIVTVPKDHWLQTKPRAMNYALPFCRGSIVGVYDAEDRPDPGQIRAVVKALQDAPPEVACVQGYLDFYNPDRNWLARCFTIEYAVWFRIVLHGVQRLGLPIPLGGTTVFFRRRALEEIGAWDAHNVTEDADLGMRLARFGFRCEMIRTVTLEEANCRPMRWIRQRSRWLKGYVITWLTHMRRPRRLWRELGPRGFLGFQVLFLGGITSYLSMPLFWAFWATAIGFDLSFWDGLGPVLLWGAVGSMAFGQLVMLATALVALRDSGRLHMVPWIVTLPVYWPLGAVAAYLAVIEIAVAPFHWHKTEHGLDRDPGA